MLPGALLLTSYAVQDHAMLTIFGVPGGFSARSSALSYGTPPVKEPALGVRPAAPMEPDFAMSRPILTTDEHFTRP